MHLCKCKRRTRGRVDRRTNEDARKPQRTANTYGRPTRRWGTIAPQLQTDFPNSGRDPARPRRSLGHDRLHFLNLCEFLSHEVYVVASSSISRVDRKGGVRTVGLHARPIALQSIPRDLLQGVTALQNAPSKLARFPSTLLRPIVRPSSLVFSSRQKMDGRLLRLARGAGTYCCGRLWRWRDALFEGPFGRSPGRTKLRSQTAIGPCGFTHRLRRADHPPSLPRCGALQDRVA